MRLWEESNRLELGSAKSLMGCRVLYVIGQLGSGGSERQLYYLLKNMDRKHYQPELVVWNFRETDTYVSKIRALDVPLHSFPTPCSRTVKLTSFRRIVKQIRPEVVHSYSFHTNFAVYWATRGIKSIPIGAVRSDLDWAKKGTGPLLGRLSARWPRKQIFNSYAAAQAALRSKSAFAPRLCLVVRNGLDLEYFHSLPLSTNGTVRIVGIGSLFPVKRWDRLTMAALPLKKRGLDFHIRIVGDGSLRASLKQHAQDLGVGDCVEFSGYADDVPRLLAEATFAVHTANAEGCPNGVMEAMSCGRAVVSTNVGDVPYLIEEGKTGFVVHAEDHAMLIERMATLIGDRNLCCSMGKAARAKAEREFGLDRFLSENFDAYTAAGWKDS